MKNTMKTTLVAAMLLAISATLGCGGGSTPSTIDGTLLLGDWVLFHSQSAKFTGNPGTKLVYYMFVDSSNFLMALCDPPPTGPTDTCQSQQYNCAHFTYTISGNVLQGTPSTFFNEISTNATSIKVSFEEQNTVWVGTATVSSGQAVNKQRKTSDLPAAVLACKTAWLNSQNTADTVNADASDVNTTPDTGP